MDALIKQLRTERTAKVVQILQRESPHLSPHFEERHAVCLALVGRQDFAQLRAQELYPRFTGSGETFSVAQSLLEQWLNNYEARRPQNLIEQRVVDRVGGVTLVDKNRRVIAGAYLPDFGEKRVEYRRVRDEVWSWTGFQATLEAVLQARGVETDGIKSSGMGAILGSSRGPVYWAQYIVNDVKGGLLAGALNDVVKERTLILNSNQVIGEDLFPGQLVYATPNGFQYYDGTPYQDKRE